MEDKDCHSSHASHDLPEMIITWLYTTTVKHTTAAKLLLPTFAYTRIVHMQAPCTVFPSYSKLTFLKADDFLVFCLQEGKKLAIVDTIFVEASSNAIAA